MNNLFLLILDPQSFIRKLTWLFLFLSDSSKFLKILALKRTSWTQQLFGLVWSCWNNIGQILITVLLNFAHLGFADIFSKKGYVFIFGIRHNASLFSYMRFLVLLWIKWPFDNIAWLLLVNLCFQIAIFNLIFNQLDLLILPKLLHRFYIRHVWKACLASLALYRLVQKVTAWLLGTLSQNLNWRCIILLLLCPLLF